MRSKGKLTSWNDKKGLGFITPTVGNNQLFIHITEFVDRSNSPVIGQTITSTLDKDIAFICTCRWFRVFTTDPKNF